MIWWLVAGALGVLGIANAILRRLRNTAEQERIRWANEHQQVERKIQEYDRQIQKKLREAQNTVDFQILTNLHFESMKVADHAYALLKDSRVALDAIGNAIVEAGKEKNKLISRKRGTWNPFKAHELEQEINALIELNRQLYPDKDQLKAQRDHFYETVVKFNARTHTLKLAIRDRCGVRGQDWYKRLEDRTNRKKLGLPSGSRVTLARGTVKWFNQNKGFGFITPHDGQKDVHVSVKNLQPGLDLKENDEVVFERKYGDKGPWAKNVRKA